MLPRAHFVFSFEVFVARRVGTGLRPPQSRLGHPGAVPVEEHELPDRRDHRGRSVLASPRLSGHDRAEALRPAARPRWVHKRAWAPRVFSDPVVRAQLSVVTSPGSRRGGLLGLFTGGTLAHEARLIAGNVGGSAAGTHRILDLGADEFTRGRPHPMICAPSWRRRCWTVRGQRRQHAGATAPRRQRRTRALRA